MSGRTRLLAPFPHSLLLIGHRGAPAHFPEHSPSSYEAAFAAGVDAVEPDVVVSRDGVLVVRHDVEIGETTDVAEHPAFADRRGERIVDGQRLEGWFAEDFTWAELQTLRCRERVPALRPASAAHDGEEPMLRLAELCRRIDAAASAAGRPLGMVLEIKHDSYHRALGWDLAELVCAELQEAGYAGPLIVESFEQGVLARLQQRGLPASFVYLMAAAYQAPDLVLVRGADAPSYADQLTPASLDVLATQLDGISLDKEIILDAGRRGVVRAAQDRGLAVLSWTARCENAFLDPRFRRGDDPAEAGDFRAEWTLLRDAGIDGMFVDDPERGIEVFRAGS